jgi:DNA-binding NarL/FixJ family response regulator
LEYDRRADTEDDLKQITDAIDADHGLSPEGKKGRLAKGNFRRVQFAVLLRRGWTAKRVARRYGYEQATVERYAREGERALGDNIRST